LPCPIAEDEPTETHLTPGYTPNELARRLRVSPDRVRDWIRRGELKAINTASRGGRPRFVVLPDQLEAFIAGRKAATSPAAPKPKRQKRTGKVDYYP
jgi:excisionase family DNA binding protein